VGFWAVKKIRWPSSRTGGEGKKSTEISLGEGKIHKPNGTDPRRRRVLVRWGEIRQFIRLGGGMRRAVVKEASSAWCRLAEPVKGVQGGEIELGPFGQGKIALRESFGEDFWN